VAYSSLLTSLLLRPFSSLCTIGLEEGLSFLSFLLFQNCSSVPSVWVNEIVNLLTHDFLRLSPKADVLVWNDLDLLLYDCYLFIC